DVSRQDGGQGAVEVGMVLKLLHLSGKGGLQMPVLFLQAVVAEGLLILEVMGGGGIGHEDKLNLVPQAAGQREEGGGGGQVEATAGVKVPGLADGGGRQGHHQLQRLAEVLIVM